MERPLSARTRKGNHVYRHPYRRDGVLVHSENYTYRVKRLGKSHYFNLGKDIKASKTLADDIANFLAAKPNTIETAIARFSPEKLDRPPDPERKIPNVGEIIRRYEEVTNHLRAATIHDNLGALRRIAAFILGLPKNPRKMTKAKTATWRASVDLMSIDRITAHQLERFRSSMIATAGTDHLLKARAITTSNFYLRAAGSIFSKKVIRHYADFILPVPNPFKETGQLQESPHRYVSTIDVGALVRSAENDLRVPHPASYIAFVLSLYCGMRRSEIDRLTWEQVDFTGHHIWIRTTEFFSPKARNSENRIDAPSNVFALLTAFREHSVTPPYVLPGTDSKYPPRCKRVFHTLLGWLRRNGVDHVQALHALRKEAGSLMFSQTGSIDKAAEFLRNDPRVAREHYIGRKGRLELDLPGHELSQSHQAGH